MRPRKTGLLARCFVTGIVFLPRDPWAGTMILVHMIVFAQKSHFNHFVDDGPRSVQPPTSSVYDLAQVRQNG